MQRLDVELDAGIFVVTDQRTGGVRQFQVTAQEVGVNVRFDDPFDTQSVFSSFAQIVVDVATRVTLAALTLGDPDLVDAGLEMRAGLRSKSGLDERTFALVKLAAIMALDAPPTSYLWQVANAIAAG